MPAERRLLLIAGRLQVRIGVDRVGDGDQPLDRLRDLLVGEEPPSNQRVPPPWVAG